ncbi:MAG: hypothetical protein COU90_03085 [Candidatus Ryanbacteria bacterium CG10_big_fil_rev_8_21_14_0_10_43_42]|uniref:Type IV secretion system coupling protein TraD DNA-binding domain-containing protein n=1 Tax=Candidatus Ryanbacteria bacterium CG10_big_fil_rev_8_21_14_0_10_43_42 TaxID=1974864 RepID=A0A2M8KWV4_9BACT|nr:MAG: hypothetical protein COU90_03085 [Candidatus Ryanbacteria bacterium CG10_big_fil_rev_8_21_14_0_10_43_42]
MDDSVAYFAKTNFRNKERMFGIQKKDRRQHMYVIGQTGTGKSTFLKNIALQDIRSGHGICIVDPHGEFVEEVLEMIPSERIRDVIYFNPADSNNPVGFNVLEVPEQTTNTDYRTIAASGLMGIFTKIWANVWSSRMEYILNNAVLALLEMPGATLLGIQRILIDKEYRKEVLSHVKNDQVRAFWTQEYDLWEPRFRNEAIAAIQNKVGQFLSSPLIRNIVGQPKTSLNLYDAMNQEKIILVNVSKGRIGEDNSQLLGAMIITKIQLAAMERVQIPEDDRKDFYLYVDEFQNFATDSFASILSEARKYRLNIIIAHQYIGQLVTETSTKVRDAVFGNVGTMVTFRVGATDAEFLEKEFAPEVTIQDLVGLPNHNIFLKLMINNVRCAPFSATTLPPLAIDTEERTAEKIIEYSRKTYARNKDEVETEIRALSKIIDAIPQSKSHKPISPVRSDHAPARPVIVPRREPPKQHESYSSSHVKKEKEDVPVPQPTKPVEPKKVLSLASLLPKKEEKNDATDIRKEYTSRKEEKKPERKKRPAGMTDLREALHRALQKKNSPVRENTQTSSSKETKQEVRGERLEPGQSVKL